MRNGQTAAPAAVHPLNADETDARAEDLAVLLVDAVASGASVGSLAPLAPAVAAAGDAAAAAGVALLHLDTETGSPAEHLYRSAGWIRAGVIPDHAADPGGTRRPTTLSCKRLGTAAAAG
ncbi:hypothetical protein QEP66_17740 [Streptomyces sp. LB8]|uniref:hypothetical protein n=1 Tax=Streptomyces sp. LB8 TaxID=3042509 RepID=UPI00264A30BC|nr:hypothetical protein [Streptomyces sp. LB8]MDN5383896.1 hypothetical protein [Streptomyces sp. LB8]